MSNIYGKGDRGKATKLHSELVRSIGCCEKCGASNGVQLQCAHIIGRKYAHTRTLMNNAFCLCAGCHRFFTDNPLEFHKFVEISELGDRYETVRQKSLDRSKYIWSDRLSELKSYKGKSLQELRDEEWSDLTT